MFTLAKRKTDDANPPVKLKRARKQIERAIAPVENVPESQQYLQLIDLEKRLDTITSRKRLHIQHALGVGAAKPETVKRTLRIFITNQIEHSDDDEYRWSLRVEGRVITDEAVFAKQVKKKKFSLFFSKIFVELANKGKTFEWSQTPLAPLNCDGFEINQKGTETTKATILMYIAHDPAKFKLTTNLSKVLGLHTATKAEVIRLLWNYVKEQKLQRSDDPEVIQVDPRLKTVFTELTTIKLSDLPTLLDTHLVPPEPVKIEYTFSPRTAVREIHDVEVEMTVDDNVEEGKYNISHNEMGKLVELDDKIQDLCQQIEETRNKRKFMDSFAADPKEFLVSWITSQARDKEELGSGSTGLTDEQRKSNYYQTRSSQEAMFRYNADKLQQQKAGLEKLKGRAMGGRNTHEYA
jgi:SWI/SNF-related matrix-associated actin-dependent regulator of chromatin subfamily D